MEKTGRKKPKTGTVNPEKRAVSRRHPGTAPVPRAPRRNTAVTKKVPAALPESDELLRSFFESAGLMRGIVEVVAEDDVRHITDNAAAAALLGMTPEAMKNKLGSELGEPREILRLWVSRCYESRKSKKPVIFEYRDTRGDKETWLLATVSSVRTPPHGCPRFAYVVIDITGRKQAEKALKESEERHRLLAETMLQGVVHQNADGTIISMNPAAEQILGKTPEEFLGGTSVSVEHDTIHEDGSLFPGRDHPSMVALQTGKQVRGVIMGVFNPREKAYRWISIDAVPLFRPGEDRPWQVYTVFEDITERRNAEAGLRKAYDELETRIRERTAELQKAVESIGTERRRLYDVLEALPVYICLLDRDYRMPFANRYFRETFAVPAGRRCYEFLFNRSEPCDTCETYTVMKTRSPHHWFWTGPNGRDYDIYDFPFTDTDGSFMVLEMGIDITEQKKAEAATEKANAYNRSLIEASLDPLVTISPDGTISDVNEATIRVTGFSREELVGTDFSDYFTEPEKAKAGYEKVFREGAVTDYELGIRHKDGHVTPVLYNAAVYRDPAGKNTGVFAAARDITGRKKAEDALRRAHALLEKRVEERTAEIVQANAQLKKEIANRMQAESLVKKTVSELHAAIESTADGIYAADCAGKIIRYNQNFASMWKIPEELLQSGEDKKVAAFLMTRVKNPGLFSAGDDGSSRHADRETYDMLELTDGRIFERYSKPQKMDRTIIGRVLSYRDVTDRRHAEEKLIASLQEKETLIREIHHRVKNNLQIISGLLDMTRMRTPDSTTSGILTDMMMKIKTMAQIHTRLYESRQFDRINMSGQIKDQVTDLSSIYGRSGAEIAATIHAEDIFLPVDQAIPCALIVNEILSNAFKHAFRGRDQGALDISATHTGGRVRIVVRDDGSGIPESVDPDRTTSLGLKLIRSLVQQLNGSIEIRNDNGTVVAVEFPLPAGGR
ncbi:MULTISPECIES: PAS domain S-box protein [unclassified Methanoregula]|uniref:PAS domain-containing sensor histidine kinase n=1 Tax=unclassified Methanoregula TaxID=2649730 RepID=UPI0009CB8F05|nr:MULTISPECIES: PAS domain S-box protein [unclassified Methanoregula]OPX61764.1 MAG: sensory histidine kinase AtoS [Methanoregula sp. PtaB.Bin085]OPY33927.1 MAG: sensory histidine kinase AtoS [Methanoregula sp. PtaU1.Bin006]